MMNNDTSLVCFKTISNFTSELGELFSKQHRPLKLYCRLIDKTTLAHDKSIIKHIEAFREFCITNREAILSKNSGALEMLKISYSQRVYIDMSEIFKLADDDTAKIIWDHILCISALIDPSGNAKEILRKNKSSGNVSEANFLTDIISKVEANVDPNANPMEAVSSILNSGVFTDLISGMNNGLSNGSLDMGKLMGAVQGMVGQLGERQGSNNQINGTMSMISSMIGNINLGGNGDDDGKAPDMAGMMQGMQGLLGGLGSSGGGATPDMMGMLQGVMSSLNNVNNSDTKKLPEIKE